MSVKPKYIESLSKGRQVKELSRAYGELMQKSRAYILASQTEIAGLREDNARLTEQVSNMIMNSIGGDGHED